MNRRASLILILLGLAVLLILPLFVPSTYLRHLVIIAMVYAVVASNWDLSLGYAGVFNFAHLAFFALGAYGAAVITKTYDLSPWLGIPAGALLAVTASVLVCLPVLRLKGIYIVLITFAFGQLCLHLVLGLSDVTGGSRGLVLIPPLTLGDFTFSQNGRLGYYYLTVALFAASTFYLRRLVASNFGLSLVALKDNEDYAVSRGISLARQRLLTFATSAVFTGAVGGLYAQYLRVVSPDLFGFGFLSLALSMLLLGGISTIYGPIIAAFLLTFLSEAMVDLGPWSYVIIATLIILVLRFFPDGLLSGLERGYRLLVRQPARTAAGTPNKHL